MKLKKVFAIVISIIMIMSVPVVFAEEIANYTTSKVVVNGTELSFEAYNINDNNYFKLRDVAKAVSGSEKQFEVRWDEEANAINLISGKSYTTVGGELAAGDGTQKEAEKSTAQIRLNGEWIEKDRLNAYTINDNNYFKLRDLGVLFNFNVSWDENANCITINTSEAYGDDGSTVPNYNITVSVVKDNKNAIYCLTTDDGYAYTTEWLDKKLKEHGMVATMGLVTDWMGKENLMTWKQAQDYVKSGRWGVASHTKAHRQAEFNNLTEQELETEINDGRNILLSKFPTQKILSMYTPGGVTSEKIISKVKENHLILRHAGGGNNYLPITANGLLALKSQAVFNSTSVETMKAWIDSAIENGGWVVEMWHGVGLYDGASWGGNLPEGYAEQHLEYVAEKMKEGKLWVTTLDEAAIYLSQYNNANLSMISKTADTVEFSLTDGLDDKIYDAELTVNIEIPNGYNEAVVVQGSKTLKTAVADRKVMVNVKPDGDNVIAKFN